MQEGKVDEELHCLVREESWAAPIVPVLKSDKSSVRICGDFQVYSKSGFEIGLLPTTQDRRPDGTARRWEVVHQARFEPSISIASPGRRIQSFHGDQYTVWPIPIKQASVWVFLRTSHLPENPPEWHSGHGCVGLRLRKDKCVFLALLVVFLGYKKDAEGLHPVAEKVEAVQRAPSLRNVTEFKAYLGLLSYYAQFLPNMSTQLAPPCALEVVLRRRKSVCHFEESTHLI